MTTIAIWRDQIILKWTGELPAGVTEQALVNKYKAEYVEITPVGPAPKNVTASLLDKLEDPSSITPFWEHIGERARFSDKLKAFLMALSKQNLQRVHRQFGAVRVVEGQGRIEGLKTENTRFSGVLAKAQLAKTTPNLPEYKYKAKPLGEYQHRGTVYLTNVKSAPLFADCGVGKTFMALCSSEQHINKGVLLPGQTLICGKLATLHQGWFEDSKKFTDLKVVVVWTGASYKRKEKLLALLNEPADVYVINHDGVRVLETALAEKRFRKVIVDESTILKSFHGTSKKIKGGAFGRALLNVSKYADWRVVMTGTPGPNGPHDLWGQMHFLDPHGFLLEASYRDFKAEYMYPEYFGNPNDDQTPKTYKPKPDSAERVGALVNPLAYRVRIRDVLPDLPELTVMRRVVPMAEEQAEHYAEMEERLSTEIDDETITVTVKLAQIGKMRQITGGFIIDADENAHTIGETPRLEVMDSLINDEIATDLKIVIFAQYRWEIEQIASRYKGHGVVTVYGGNDGKENVANIERFIKDPSVRIVVLHPKSGGHGITFTVAHYMIFYSLSYSAEEDYQCVKRIERASQKHPMFVYYLLCEDSIDEIIYATVQAKQRTQAALIDPDKVDEDVAIIWNELREQIKRHRAKRKRRRAKTVQQEMVQIQ